VADFSELRVWKAAHAMSLEAYRVTARFPRTEQFGMISQVRRASVSIAANIAESSGRHNSLDQARFLQMAKGSAKELRSHLLIARDLGFITDEQHAACDQRVITIERMLTALIGYHRSRGQRRSSILDPPSQ